MLAVPLLATVVSIGFLTLVAAAMLWFAYLGYRDDHRSTRGTGGNRRSLAE